MIETSLRAFAVRVFAAMVGGRAFLLVLVFVFTAGTQAIAQTMTAPDITSEGPFLVDEGETAVATLTADDSDTAAGDLIWSKTGGADSGKFSLTSAGVLTFIAAKDYEAPDDDDADGTYEVTVQVSDGTETDLADLVVTLENVVELTAITGPASVEFPENSWSRVATFTASSEEDRAGIEWILTGTDRDHFSIDNPLGALRFALDAVAPRIFSEPPDFEAPVDPAAANTYELTLLAEAGSSVTDTHTFTVTVTDVDEEGALALSATRPALGTALTADPTDPDGVDRRNGPLAVGAVHGPQLLGRDRRRRFGELHAGGGGHEHVSAGDGDLRGRARDRQDGQRGAAQCGHGAPVDGSDSGER